MPIEPDYQEPDHVPFNPQCSDFHNPNQYALHLRQKIDLCKYLLPGILPDHEIRKYIDISPFAEGIKREDVISYGLGHYGYDARLGYKFKVFTPVHCTVINPKKFDNRSFVAIDLTPHNGSHELKPDYSDDTVGPRCDICIHCGIRDSVIMLNECPKRPLMSRELIIPPNSFVLAETLETFKIPRDILAIVLGKSTLARCGLIVNVTPLEPEWEGRITIEISNTAPLPNTIFPGEGIMQILFLRGSSLSHTSYATKGGKYQGQSGLTLPTVDRAKE